MACLEGCKNAGSGLWCQRCWQSRQYQSRRDAGLCYKCGGVRESAHKQCQACRVKYKPKKMVRTETVEPKKESGLIVNSIAKMNMEIEMRGTKTRGTANSTVTTYMLSEEELAKYRAMPVPVVDKVKLSNSKIW